MYRNEMNVFIRMNSQIFKDNYKLLLYNIRNVLVNYMKQ